MNTTPATIGEARYYYAEDDALTKERSSTPATYDSCGQVFTISATSCKAGITSIFQGLILYYSAQGKSQKGVCSSKMKDFKKPYTIAPENH